MENKELEGIQQVKDYHVEAAKKLIAFADDPVLRDSDVKHYRKRAQEHLDMVDRLYAVIKAQYTAVDMATAAAEGFRDGAKSVVVELPKLYSIDSEESDSRCEHYNRAILLCKAAIIAAGGSVK